MLMIGARPAVVLIIIALASAGCANPDPTLWPPGSGAPSRTIIVSLDTWHAMIALPSPDQPSAPPVAPDEQRVPGHQLFEEWGYAEHAWYLEGRTGFLSVFRALFWPSAGVVEVARYDRVWADRTPQPPSERFIFQVGETGYARLRRHLDATIGHRTPVQILDRSTFYPATRAYHLFHQCHQYAAIALREAGLPVSSLWAVSPGLLAAQLRRADRVGREAAEASVP